MKILFKSPYDKYQLRNLANSRFAIPKDLYSFFCKLLDTYQKEGICIDGRTIMSFGNKHELLLDSKVEFVYRGIHYYRFEFLLNYAPIIIDDSVEFLLQTINDIVNIIDKYYYFYNNNLCSHIKYSEGEIISTLDKKGCDFIVEDVYIKREGTMDSISGELCTNSKIKYISKEIKVGKGMQLIRFGDSVIIDAEMATHSRNERLDSILD